MRIELENDSKRNVKQKNQEKSAMTKVKSNALWNELTPEKRKTLDTWLFENKLSYAEILPRAQSELGFKGSESSLKRYFARRHKERAMEEFLEVRDEVAALRGEPTDATTLRAAAMKLLGRFLLKQVRSSPGDVKNWAPVANLMVLNDHNELLRAAKSEEREIRREALALSRERFEFNTMERALEAMPQLKELAQAKKDPLTKRYEENIHWNRVRRAMFGGGTNIHPESEQEEMEMLAAKHERDARNA